MKLLFHNNALLFRLSTVSFNLGIYMVYATGCQQYSLLLACSAFCLLVNTLINLNMVQYIILFKLYPSSFVINRKYSTQQCRRIIACMTLIKLEIILHSRYILHDKKPCFFPPLMLLTLWWIFEVYHWIPIGVHNRLEPMHQKYFNQLWLFIQYHR